LKHNQYASNPKFSQSVPNRDKSNVDTELPDNCHMSLISTEYLGTTVRVILGTSRAPKNVAKYTAAKTLVYDHIWHTCSCKTGKHKWYTNAYSDALHYAHVL